MIRSGDWVYPCSSWYPLSHESLCTLLRGVLAEGVQAGCGAEEGIASLRCRASGALYALLMAHPIDQHGRCHCCARPGVLRGHPRQHCRVHFLAHYWLRQPEWLLSFQLDEWGLGRPSPPRAPGGADHLSDPTDPAGTDVPPPIEVPSDPVSTQRAQTPAAPPPPPHRSTGAGRPDPDTAGQG
jgi:hypothetical protein